MTTEQLQAVTPWVAAAIAVVFGVLAVVSSAGARRQGRSAWWATAMFSAMVLYLGGSILVNGVDGEPRILLAKLSLLVLLLFPYLVVRFAGSFRRVPVWRRRASAAVTVAVIGAAVPLDLSDPGSWVTVWLVAVLVYWTALSSVAATYLWRAGRGQPTVARRRMRLMSVATIALALSLLVSGLASDGSAAGQIVVMSLLLASAIIFGLGLRPPRALVLTWRRPEDRQLRHAMMAVLRAATVDEVATELLPPVVSIMGGSGAVLTDAEQRVTATYGDAPAVGSTLAPGPDVDGGRAHAEVVELPDGRGRLVVFTSRYTPFFAREEVELLHGIAVFATLAMERCDLLSEERSRTVALEQARTDAEAAREAADHANAAKSEFLSRMSHEFRTPLNAILGFGQLLEPSSLAPDDAESVGYIVKAGRHLLALVNDVLDLARVEAGEMTISPEPVHVAELVDDAVALMRPLAKERSIDLDVVPDGRDVFVQADRQRCRQILLNLLSNAVKYNRDGGSVRVRCAPVGEGMLRISVSDTGPGIDAQRQQRLFQPFERLDADRSGVEGTGLGLALTKHLVQVMGGDIGVESAVGRGSTFWIDVPLTAGPTGPEEAGAGGDTAASAQRSGTVLLVEDNMANVRLVEAILRRRPHVTVLPAMQGRLAIDLAQQHRPDVVLLDVHLPDISGREVLQRLQADPSTRDIPVIIATADASPHRERQLREEGAFGYLTKPLDPRRFIEAVDSALALARVD